jgi:hypothetical protein
VSDAVYDIQSLENCQQPDGSFSFGSDVTLNNTVWSVIALEMAKNNGYSVDYNEYAAMDYIAENQKPTGGFDGSGWGEDVDSTCQALVALSFQKDSYVEVINDALEFVYSHQLSDSLFDNYGPSIESTAAVIEALYALGYENSTYINEMIRAMLEYQLPDGSFCPTWDEGNYNEMTTYMAGLALADYYYGESKYHRNLQSSIPIGSEDGDYDPDSGVSLIKDVSESNGLLNILVEPYPDIIEERGFSILVSMEQNNELVNFCSVPYKSNSAETVKVTFKKVNGPVTIKCFIWDSLEGMHPLCDESIYDYQGGI